MHADRALRKRSLVGCAKGGFHAPFPYVIYKIPLGRRRRRLIVRVKNGNSRRFAIVEDFLQFFAHGGFGFESAKHVTQERICFLQRVDAKATARLITICKVCFEVRATYSASTELRQPSHETIFCAGRGAMETVAFVPAGTGGARNAAGGVVEPGG